MSAVTGKKKKKGENLGNANAQLQRVSKPPLNLNEIRILDLIV